ncbi:hypothetical protein [Trinickia mobilis]|uniref:hypothetical protein n=1 Tax=Trinickia mobilis TaxID=2816356 RepID=UPI001A8D903D|nr:hypothetical protein [Trinickia mobilis]
MNIDLHRTFSEHTNSATKSDDEDWLELLGQRQGRKTWADLHEEPLVVVLGEAGIGKTIEFQSEVARLREAGRAAFFIPLNQLSDAESWKLVLTGFEAEFDAWAASDELGYFFLDAVDEARLKSHAELERALTVVQRALGSNFVRVRIAVSSRVTDWAIPGVRSAVDARLVRPIERAFAAKTVADAPLASTDSPTVTIAAVPATPPVEAFVVGLDPLSIAESRRCAAAYCVQDEDKFWKAVADGDYEFMATRPLDLRWMVVLWNQHRSLGNYHELIEANISNRLREFNESYEAAGEVLSLEQLRTGAIDLAAAAEFGGCQFFTLDFGTTPAVGELAPHTVLADWHPTAVRRLLATAVFDEASYGRVKFHHRSIREFLAAQWVAKQLALGVPLQRLQGLFALRPFGQSVLIPARRASLSWLAAINVTVREWVVREFPEILLFEGDPQAWDGISADKAFANFIEATKHGLEVGWFNSASEYMRVGRVLGVGKVAEALADANLAPRARSMCFNIARYAGLADCALVSFTIYRNPAAPAWERALALDVLEFVGTADQRQEILADLKAGLLGTNELIARAMPVADWTHLTEAELSAILNCTHDEAEYGSGPMVRIIKDELLPAADLSAAILLLGAVMASLPRPAPGKRFARFPESDRPERAWLLNALPDCYERVLALLPQTLDSYPAVCMEAAERIEAQRHSGFDDRDESNRLHKAIAQHPALRWSVALAIAQSEDIKASVSRLTWGATCLVSFGAADLPELTRRANDPVRPADERDIWFAVAVAAAFSRRLGRERANALRALGLGSTGSRRSLLIGREYEGWRKGGKQRREWKASERERTAADTRAVEEYKSRLLADLTNIRDGTLAGSLQSLLQYSFSRLKQRDYSDIDFEAVATSLSPEIAAAFEEGLKAYWPTVTPPVPSSYANGEVPWIALIALAGLRSTFRDPSSTPTLSAMNVAKAAQLAVWELHGPPPWLDALARSHGADVKAALTPWVVAEAQAASPGNGVRGALEMALRCTPDVRRALLEPLVPLVSSGQISRRETLKEIIIALRADGLLPPATIGPLCLGKLMSSIGSNGRLGEMEWFRIWMDGDTTAAWTWFLGHVQGIATSDVEGEVSAFAEVVGDLKWLQTPLSYETADVLLGIHALLSAHPPTAPIPETASDNHFFGPPSKRLRDAIPNVFLGTRGRIGHDSLVALLDTIADPTERNWITGRLIEHAALDAAQSANRTSEQLKSIGSPFFSAPCTEAQLYEQAMARLEEIRKNLEEGPFSERDLFRPGMPEKFLQRWLAAKFRETQNRRFSVHREEEVDDDNMTDIQLSCPAGNVCVEIKPVDADRSYSANSLTGTLQTQIVGQYLKGTNSSRGILVLMQLDNKTWTIPGGSAGQPFAALVGHLEAQAESIKRNSAGVNELTVFGIRCVV